MVCIYCGSKTQVINSRPQKRTNSNWRRRECQNCQIVFTTIESIDYSGSWRVAKHKNDLVPFSRDELFSSIYESCKHRSNPATDATALTDTIVNLLARSYKDALIERSQIINLTEQVLVRFDKAAAVHYTAFHPL